MMWQIAADATLKLKKFQSDPTVVAIAYGLVATIDTKMTDPQYLRNQTFSDFSYHASPLDGAVGVVSK